MLGQLDNSILPPSRRNVNASEAGILLGLHRSTIAKLCKAGRVVGAEMVGPMWVIPLPIRLTPGLRGPRGRANEPDVVQRYEPCFRN